MGWVRSPVRELRSHIPWSVAKNLKIIQKSASKVVHFIYCTGFCSLITTFFAYCMAFQEISSLFLHFSCATLRDFFIFFYLPLSTFLLII